MKKMLFVTPVFDSRNSDGLNIRVTNLAMILARYYELSLLCLATPWVDESLVKFSNVSVVRGFRFRKLKKLEMVVRGKSVLSVFEKLRSSAIVSDAWDSTDMVFSCLISRANIFACKKFQGKPLIVDYIDSISLHYQEATSVKWGRRLWLKFELPRVQVLEEKIIRATTLGLITSDVEKKALCWRSPDQCSRKIKVLSNGVQGPQEFKGPSESRGVVGFLGRMDYYPNIDSARRLVKEIIPLLTSRGLGLRCKIIGANPTKEVVSWQSSIVQVTGFVSDIGAALEDVDLVVLPMTVASGIQNKLLSCLAHGKVVITTERVNTGTLPFVHMKNIVFAESNNDYCDLVELLLKSRELTGAIGHEAFSMIAETSGWEAISTRLVKILSDFGLL